MDTRSDVNDKRQDQKKANSVAGLLGILSASGVSTEWQGVGHPKFHPQGLEAPQK